MSLIENCSIFEIAMQSSQYPDAVSLKAAIQQKIGYLVCFGGDWQRYLF